MFCCCFLVLAFANSAFAADDSSSASLGRKGGIIGANPVISDDNFEYVGFHPSLKVSSGSGATLDLKQKTFTKNLVKTIVGEFKAALLKHLLAGSVNEKTTNSFNVAKKKGTYKPLAFSWVFGQKTGDYKLELHKLKPNFEKEIELPVPEKKHKKKEHPGKVEVVPAKVEVAAAKVSP